MMRSGRPQQDVASVRNGLDAVCNTGKANRRRAAGDLEVPTGDN